MPEQDYRELYVSIFKEIAQKNVPLKFLYLRSIDDNHADRITQAVSNQIDDISELSVSPLHFCILNCCSLDSGLVLY